MSTCSCCSLKRVRLQGAAPLEGSFDVEKGSRRLRKMNHPARNRHPSRMTIPRPIARDVNGNALPDVFVV